MAERITLRLVARPAGVYVDPRPVPPAWDVECCMCGSSDLWTSLTPEGEVYEDYAVVCWSCGAVDGWRVDEGEAQLAHLPDGGGTIEVLRGRYLAGGRAEWVERARTVDRRVEWIVEAGDTVTPLLGESGG